MKTVFCRKYQKDLPKMDRAPFPGEKGEEIFSSVSKQAWMEWLQQQTMLVNEKQLDLSKKESLPEIIHNLSHRKLNISTVKYQIKNKDRLKIDRSSSVWVSKADSVKTGIPKPIKEIIETYL